MEVPSHEPASEEQISLHEHSALVHVARVAGKIVGPIVELGTRFKDGIGNIVGQLGAANGNPDWDRKKED